MALAMRAQFNVRIPRQTKRRVDAERKRIAIASGDIITELALENWFTSLSAEQREAFYRAHDRRPYRRAA